MTRVYHVQHFVLRGHTRTGPLARGTKFVEDRSRMQFIRQVRSTCTFLARLGIYMPGLGCVNSSTMPSPMGAAAKHATSRTVEQAQHSTLFHANCLSRQLFDCDSHVSVNGNATARAVCGSEFGGGNCASYLCGRESCATYMRCIMMHYCDSRAIMIWFMYMCDAGADGFAFFAPSVSRLGTVQSYLLEFLRAFFQQS